uniref:C-CAP/cofactor C-like domain-containing protein n=1 Tax=Spumella elongata TaxID=89044 RepID=A0A7S3MFR8_9STRA
MDQQDESTLTDLTLSIDTPGNIRNNGSEGNNGGNVPYSSINPTVDFAIAKKTVDALGLIVCGGYSRDQAVPQLSSLFPVLNGSEESSVMRQGKGPFAELPTIAFSELSAWINVHMSMNDTLYPVSVSPSYGAIPCSPTTRDMPHISTMSATDADAAGKDSPSTAREKAQQPSRTVNTVTSLSRSKPTIINGCSTTVIHVIGGLTTAKSSFRKYRSMSFERTESNHSAHNLRTTSDNNMREHVLSDSDSDKTSPLGPGRQRGDTSHSDNSFDDINLFDDTARHAEDIEMWMRNNNNYLSKPETMLPPLYLNLCTRAKMYLISPYHSATITGCSDCEIVVGAVFGALIVSNCERVKITAACRKLLVLNCLDCAFNVATLTTTIIAGDCRSLVVGPHNTSYRNLRNHLKLAALEPLLSSEDPSANPTIPAALCAAAASVEHVHGKELHRTLSQQVNGKGDSASPNCWASLCDVSSCLEAATTSGSPAGYAIDAMDDACPLLPPLPSTARLLPYENFRAVAIPFKAEAIPFDQSPIRTPLEYVDSLRQYRESVSHIKAQVASVLAAPAAPASTAGAPPAPANAANTLSPEERKRKQIVGSTAVSKKFMEWLVSTGNAKQVLDLIRIDGEKTSINNQNNNH